MRMEKLAGIATKSNFVMFKQPAADPREGVTRLCQYKLVDHKRRDFRVLGLHI